METTSEPNGLRLPSTLLDSGGVSTEDWADMIRGFFLPTMNITFPAETGTPPIGRVEMWRLGSLLVMDGVSGTFDLSRSTRQIERDGLDHWIVRVLRKGSISSRSGNHACGQAAGEVVLASLATASEDRWSEVEWVSFIVPRQGFESLAFVDAHHCPLDRASVRLFGDFALSVVDHLRQATVADTLPLTHATEGMIRSCFLQAVAPDTICRDDILQLDRERVRSLIRRNLASPRLTPERICELTGLSRSALYRLFEAHGGVSSYIQRERLNLAMKDLSDPLKAMTSISVLAEASGFHNAPAFSRTFRRHYGYTPSQARHAAICGLRLATVEPAGTAQFARLLG